METPEQAVTALQKAIDRDGLSECMEQFNQLCDHGSAVIRPLLLMRNYHDNDDYLHEMYGVIHLVESFPPATYFAELAKSICDLRDSSPYLLWMLLVRIMNVRDENEAILFRSSIANLDEKTRRSLLSIVVDIQAHNTKNRILVRCAAAIAILNRSE